MRTYLDVRNLEPDGLRARAAASKTKEIYLEHLIAKRSPRPDRFGVQPCDHNATSHVGGEFFTCPSGQHAVTRSNTKNAVDVIGPRPS